MDTKTHHPDPNDEDCSDCFIAERELELLDDQVDVLNIAFNEKCRKFCAADRISSMSDIEIQEYRKEFDNLWKQGNVRIMELYKCELRRKKD